MICYNKKKEEINKHGKILGRISRLNKIIKRRKSIFITYHIIEKQIGVLERKEMR